MKRVVVFLSLFILVTFFNSIEVTLYCDDDVKSIEGDTFITQIIKSSKNFYKGTEI